MLKKLIKILITGALIIGLFELAAWAKMRWSYDFDMTGHDITNVNNIDITGQYKISGSQISSDDLSDTASIGMLDENETLTGNWVNTDNPWADNEVVADLTINSTKDITTTTKVETPEVTTASGDLTLNATGSNITLSSKKLTSPATLTRHYVIGSCEFGRNPTNPPVVNIYGITQALEFTVNTDLAYYKLHIPDDYASGDLLFYVHWTRSTTGTDESTKTVKWQLKYLAIDGTSENCNSGEATLSIQDTYDSVSTTEQVVYRTDGMTILAANFASTDVLILELGAITVDSGEALSEPAAVAVDIFYTANQIIQ